MTSLLPKLLGKVFHWTNWDNYISIKRDGFIDAYKDGRYSDYDVSMLPYGPRHGLVCLFDLRGDIGAIEREISWSILDWQYFLGARRNGVRAAYQIPDPGVYDELIPNGAARNGAGYFTKGKAIPYIECWYSRPLPLKLIGEVYDVTVTAQPRPQMADGKTNFAVHSAQLRWDKKWSQGSLSHELSANDENGKCNQNRAK